MTDKFDLVSIIIPCYNCAKFVAQTIESALNQTYPNKEIIVINDGSTDNSLEIISQYKDKIKIISQINQGAAACRNNGILSSNGKYIMFVDSDDILSSETLESKIKILQADDNIGLVIGKCFIFNETGVKACGYSSEFIDKLESPFRKVVENGIYGVDPLYRKEVFANCGIFDTALTNTEDTEFYIRVARKYKIGFDSNIFSFNRQFARKTLSHTGVESYINTYKRLKSNSILENNKFIYAYIKHFRVLPSASRWAVREIFMLPFIQAVKQVFKLTFRYPCFPIHFLSLCIQRPIHMLIKPYRKITQTFELSQKEIMRGNQELEKYDQLVNQISLISR